MSRRRPLLTRRDLLVSTLGLGAGAAAATVAGRVTGGAPPEAPTPEVAPPTPAAPTTAPPAPPRPVDVPGQPLEVLWSALRRSRVAPCRLVFVGSSTTEGAVASDAAHRYVNLVAAALQAAHPSGAGDEPPVQASADADFGALSPRPGVHVYNAGDGGTRSSDYLPPPKADRIAALRPAAVVHMIGANDFRAGVAPSAYRRDLGQSLGSLRGRLGDPCVHVLVHSYQPVDGSAQRAPHPWAAYGAVLTDLAALDDRDDTVAVDLSGAYRRLGVPGDDRLGLLDRDRLHQNDAGHAVMAELLLRELLPR